MTSNPSSSIAVAELPAGQDGIAAFATGFAELSAALSTAILGADDLVRDCLVAICAGGHVLLEGVPGLGKTSLVKAIAAGLGLDHGRIQCTPDLMPADILGTHILDEDEQGRRRMAFHRGPVFHHILLVDEINRATPKTQSALLEVMQERRVSTGRESLALPEPFFVMATQNPLEMEGTYPLPEAQLDRFLFKVKVAFPGLDTLVAIGQQTTGLRQAVVPAVWSGAKLLAMQEVVAAIPIAEPVTRYAARLVLATHPDQPGVDARVQRAIAYGASPRGMQALIRAGRVHCALRRGSAVSVADLRAVALPALRHRVIRNFEGEAEALDIDKLITDLLRSVPVPAEAERG